MPESLELREPRGLGANRYSVVAEGPEAGSRVGRGLEAVIPRHDRVGLPRSAGGAHRHRAAEGKVDGAS